MVASDRTNLLLSVTPTSVPGLQPVVALDDPASLVWRSPG
jgi:hypothetical protein